MTYEQLWSKYGKRVAIKTWIWIDFAIELNVNADFQAH